MPKGVKSHQGSGFNFGFVGKREQSSKSKLDGQTFVGTSTTESRALRGAYKGQGSSTKVLTKNPNHLQVARHKQTGLFNLSAFMHVNHQPPRTAPPPRISDSSSETHAMHSDKESMQSLGNSSDSGLLEEILVDGLPRQLYVDNDAPILIEDYGIEDRIAAATGDAVDRLKDDLSILCEGLAQPRNHDRNRGLIIQRDRLATSVETWLAELRQLEREVRELEPNELTQQHLEAIGRAKREVALVALKLSMPGLAPTRDDAPTPDPEELEVLAERLVALGDRLQAAGADPNAYDLTKLIGLLSSHGRIRELSEYPVSEAKTEAVAGMASLIDALLVAVGPGRDGVELNGLLGHSGELDGVLKLLRHDAVRNLLARDLARRHECAVDELSLDDWNEVARLTEEVVRQDAEMAQARQQIRRALEAAGAKNFDLNGLAGLRVDTALIRGLRKTFGGDAKKVGLIVAALQAMERASLASDGTKRLRQALKSELEELRMERDREAKQSRTALFVLQDNSNRMSKLEAEIKELRARLPNEPENRHDINRQIEERELDFKQRLIDRKENLWPALKALTDLDRRVAQLEERIRSLTPEAVLISDQITAIEAARGKIEEGLAELGRQRQSIVLRRDNLRAAGHLDDSNEIKKANEDLAKVEVLIAELDMRLGVNNNARVHFTARLAPLQLDLLRARYDETLPDLEHAWDEQEQRLGAIERIDKCLAARATWLVDEPPIGEPTEEELELLNDPDLARHDDDALLQLRGKFEALLPQAFQARLGQILEDIEAEEQQQLQLGDRISSTGGLTRQEIEQLGLTEGELDQIAEVSRGLARQGLSSTKQVSEICRNINGLMARMGSGLRNDIGGALSNQMRVLGAGNNDQLAGRFGLELVRSLTGDPNLTFDDEEFDEQMQNSLFGIDGDAGRLERLTRMLGEHEIDSSLEEAKQVYAFYQDALVDLLNDKERKYVQSIEAVRQFPGRNIDPGRPSGLAVSTALREAVRLAKKIDSGDAKPGDLENFDNYRQQLRGFNPDTLEVPFWQFDKEPPDLDDILDWGENKVLMDAAEGIIFLREEAPHFQTVIERCVSSMDIAVDRRMRLMGETGVALRDTIRAAILHTFARTGLSIEEFRPGTHVDAIKDTLAGWGVPVEEVLPEINRQLSESFGPDELNLWIETTKLSRELVEARKENKAQIDQHVGELDDGNEAQRLKPHVAKELLELGRQHPTRYQSATHHGRPGRRADRADQHHRDFRARRYHRCLGECQADGRPGERSRNPAHQGRLRVDSPPRLGWTCRRRLRRRPEDRWHQIGRHGDARSRGLPGGGRGSTVPGQRGWLPGPEGHAEQSDHQRRDHAARPFRHRQHHAAGRIAGLGPRRGWRARPLPGERRYDCRSADRREPHQFRHCPEFHRWSERGYHRHAEVV